MSFLAPMFLLGALAVGLPILFHLIRRTARDRVPFSSLMFLRPSPPRLTRRSRLEHILLLLLRCLVFCLLAAAFARPFFQAAFQPESSALRHLVLLVDTSASLRREALWSEAKAKVMAWVRRAEEGDRMALLAFDRDVRTVMDFDTWASIAPPERAAAVEQRLETLSPGWGETQLGRALIEAIEMFQDAETDSATPVKQQIVLVSDLPEGGRLDGLGGLDWPRTVNVVLEGVRARRPDNAGIHLLPETEMISPRATNDSAWRVRVQNAANSTQDTFQLTWATGTVAQAAGPALDVQVPPGQSRVVRLPRSVPTGVPVTLQLAGDAADFDNRAFFAPYPQETIRLLFLGPDASEDPTQLLYYLGRAFQPTRRETVVIESPRPGEALTPQQLGRSRLVFLADGARGQAGAALRPWLTNGGTAVLVLRQAADAARVADWVDGAGLRAEEVTAQPYALFGQIDFSHPLFKPFADPRFSDFTKIHFWKYRRLDVSGLPGAQVVARFDPGDPALVHVPVGRGHLLILACGWQPSESQLALSSKFVPLLYAMLDLAGGRATRQNLFTVGDAVPAEVLGDTREHRVRRPDGAEISLAAGQPLVETGLPGFYTVLTSEPPLVLGVNVAAEESKTAPLAREALEALGVPIRDVSDAVMQREARWQRRQHADALENSQKNWRWLLVAALLFLLTETWLAGRLARVPAAGP